MHFAGQTGENWEIKMLYDGDCPLCMREVNMLKKRDKDQHKIGFVDISSPDYIPANNAGISYEQVGHCTQAALIHFQRVLDFCSFKLACSDLCLERKKQLSA